MSKIHDDIYGKLVADMILTRKKKNNDYGDSFNKGCDKFGIVSALSRIDEKNDRVCNLLTNENQMVDDEKVEDTLIDMANYCLMLATYIKAKKCQETQKD